MSTIAGGLLLIALFLFVFWPERNVEAQRLKTRLEYLRERRETVFENLRDLNFEYRAGKYPEEDYTSQRAALENEAAEIVAEIDVIETQVFASNGSAPQHISY